MLVLLIEDSAACAELTRLKLALWRPETTCDTVGSLALALAALATTRYDLIVLDLTLLDTWDIEAVAPVVDAAHPSATPVLVFTGARPDLEPRVLAEGAAGMLGKDAPTAHFHQLLTRLTHGRARHLGS